MRKEILVIEDIMTHAELIEAWFEADGWVVLVASTGHEGLLYAQERVFDAIILDLALETKERGFEVIRSLRKSEKTCRTPLVVFSALTSNEDLRVRALHLGADYVLVKIERLFELEAVLNRLIGSAEHGRLGYGGTPAWPIDYDYDTNTVFVEGKPLAVRLPLLQARLLRLLVERRGRICNDDQIIKHVYDDEPMESAAIERLMTRLRQSIGDDARRQRYIITERGLGYRLNTERPPN